MIAEIVLASALSFAVGAGIAWYTFKTSYQEEMLQSIERILKREHRERVHAFLDFLEANTRDSDKTMTAEDVRAYIRTVRESMRV